VPDGPPESVFDEFARGKEIQVTGLNEQTELKALAWFCKAAKDKRSHASFDSGQAAYEIGEMYLEGFVLPYTNRSQSAEPDIAIAFDWFMKAATDGNTNGMDRLAFLYMGGSQIKGNPKPKDIALSVTYLKNAVKRNDSWAILNLKLVASIGLVTLSEPETRDLSKRLDAALIKATPLENPCLSAEILDEINRLTPERDVLDVQTQSGVAIPEVAPFALYGDSFVCLAHLGPVQNEFLDHQKWGYFSGSPIEYWKYTVYMRPEGGKPLTKRAALRQMVSDYADTFATLAAPLRSQ
jgi:TPR repeat protein